MGIQTPPPVNNTVDPTFASDSNRAASTSWVRRCFGAMATAAGFAFDNSAASGGINLPSWLGGFQARWGTIAAQGAVAFKTPFSNACLGVAPVSEAGAGVHVRVHAVGGTITVNGFTYDTENVNNSAGRYWAWGY